MANPDQGTDQRNSTEGECSPVSGDLDAFQLDFSSLGPLEQSFHTKYDGKD